MASSEEKRRAVEKAALKGFGSLSGNERHAFEQARHDMTDIGRQAENIASGKKTEESNRNFFGF